MELFNSEILTSYLEGKLSQDKINEIEKLYRHSPQFHGQVDKIFEESPEKAKLQKEWGQYRELIRQFASFYPAQEPTQEQSLRIWQKIQKESGSRSQGILVKFSKGNESIEQRMMAKAAGERAQMTPEIRLPKLLVGEESISLRLQPADCQDCFYIEFEGGSYRTRCAIEVRMCYQNGEADIFSGKAIAQGGSWTLSGDKSRRIASIEIKFNERT